MTIAATYLVSDGVVFGADSSTTVEVQAPQGKGVIQLLTHSQKVFEVGENSRFGVCTWGAGSLGKLSHRTVIAQLAEKIGEDTSVEKAAAMLGEITESIVKKENVPFVGYYLGGWNPSSHEPACFQITIKPSGKEITSLKLGLCSFSGMPEFFNRVFRGYDPSLKDRLCEKLRERLFSGNIPKDFDSNFGTIFEEIAAQLVAAGFPDLPIREAIDFVYSYLHITVKANKFKFGPPMCGGPIEIGFISTDRRFRWVRHKSFSSAIIEQEGEYDVK